MIEYKGLKVPDTIMTDRQRQAGSCSAIVCNGDCEEFSCKDCLFDYSHLEQFLEWEAQRERDD